MITKISERPAVEITIKVQELIDLYHHNINLYRGILSDILESLNGSDGFSIKDTGIVGELQVLIWSGYNQGEILAIIQDTIDEYEIHDYFEE